MEAEAVESSKVPEDGKPHATVKGQVAMLWQASGFPDTSTPSLLNFSSEPASYPHCRLTDWGQGMGFISAVKYDKMKSESPLASESSSHRDEPGWDTATQAGGQSDGICWRVKAGGGLRTAGPICSPFVDLGSLQGWILCLSELATAWGPTTGHSPPPAGSDPQSGKQE